MSTDRQRAILEAVASGEVTPEEAFERLEIEAILDRYPYGTTHELRDILARQSMADDIRIRHWSGTQGWRG